MPSITATSNAKPPNIPPSIDPIFAAPVSSLGRKSAIARVAWDKSDLGIGIVEATEGRPSILCK